MLTATLLAMSALSAPAPADYVLVPVPARRIVVRDYVLLPVVRSVVTRRTVVVPPPTVIRTVPAAPVVRYYYDPQPTYVPLRSGYYYCPSCR